jgi:hypothetical protein
MARQRSQIRHNEIDRVARLSLDGLCNGCTFFSVTADNGHLGAHTRQFARRDQTKAIGPTRDQDCFSLYRSFHMSLHKKFKNNSQYACVRVRLTRILRSIHTFQILLSL